MKRFLFGFVAGSILILAATIPILILEKNSKYESGMVDGITWGRLEIAEILEKEFGTISIPNSNPRDIKMLVLRTFQWDRLWGGWHNEAWKSRKCLHGCWILARSGEWSG